MGEERVHILLEHMKGIKYLQEIILKHVCAEDEKKITIKCYTYRNQSTA